MREGHGGAGIAHGIALDSVWHGCLLQHPVNDDPHVGRRTVGHQRRRIRSDLRSLHGY